jgi:hypothetical protein
MIHRISHRRLKQSQRKLRCKFGKLIIHKIQTYRDIARIWEDILTKNPLPENVKEKYTWNIKGKA